MNTTLKDQLLETLEDDGRFLSLLAASQVDVSPGIVRLRVPVTTDERTIDALRMAVEDIVPLAITVEVARERDYPPTVGSRNIPPERKALGVDIQINADPFGRAQEALEKLKTGAARIHDQGFGSKLYQEAVKREMMRVHLLAAGLREESSAPRPVEHATCGDRGCIGCPQCHGCGAKITTVTAMSSRHRSGVFCPACVEPELRARRAEIEAEHRALELRLRRKREAPLAALVANVPEGLDANGWRAAVLAVEEFGSAGPHSKPWNTREIWDEHAITASLERCAATSESWWEGIVEIQGRAIRAYHRAIAPQGPRPKPERRTRGPRLVIDNGED